MKSNTPDLMKFKRLQRQLGESTRSIIGLLEMLWIATAKNCPGGDIGRFADDEIAIMCDWPHDPTLLVETLVQTGWLDHHPNHRLVVHDWQEHAPKWVKGVVARRNLGWATLGSLPKVATPGTPTLGGLPSNTKPSQAKIEEGVPSSCPEANLGLASRQSAVQQVFKLEQEPPQPNVVLTFPVKAPDGKPKTWDLRADRLEELQQTFAPLDVLGECKKALVWLKSTKRWKTAAGMPRFLFTWIEKANNNGGPRHSVHPKQTQTAADIMRLLED